MQLSRENSSHLTWNEELDDNEDNSVFETKKPQIFPTVLIKGITIMISLRSSAFRYITALRPIYD